MSAAQFDRQEPYRVYDVDDFLGESLGSERQEVPRRTVPADIDHAAPVLPDDPPLAMRRGRRLLPFLLAAAAAALVVTIERSSSVAPVARSHDAPQLGARRRAASPPAPAEPANRFRSRRHRRGFDRPRPRTIDVASRVEPARSAPKPADTPQKASSAAGEFGFER